MTIDFLAATPKQIIERSHRMHPFLFGDAIRNARDEHFRYSGRAANEKAATIAADMGHDCERILLWLQNDDVDGVCAETSTRTIALTEALKLQCVPRSLWADIASR